MINFLHSFKVNSYIKRVKEEGFVAGKLDDMRNTFSMITLLGGILGVVFTQLLTHAPYYHFSYFIFYGLIISPIIYSTFRVHVNHYTKKMLAGKNSFEVIAELEQLKKKAVLVANIEKEYHYLNNIFTHPSRNITTTTINNINQVNTSKKRIKI